MAHLGSRAFGSISGDVVQTTAFIIRNGSLVGHRPAFFRLIDGGEQDKKASLANGSFRFDNVRQSDFSKIPGMPVAYWAPKQVISAFSNLLPLEKIGRPKQGATTSDNSRFLRLWWEVSLDKIGFNIPTRGDAVASNKKWFPYNKGGEFRKVIFINKYFVDRLFNCSESVSRFRGIAT